MELYVKNTKANRNVLKRHALYKEKEEKIKITIDKRN